MLTSLSTSMEQTLILLFREEFLKKTIFPKPFQIIEVQTLQHLRECLENAKVHNKRCLLMVQEEDFFQIENFLKSKDTLLNHLAVVVISKNPLETLRNHHHFLQVLDSATEKEVKRDCVGLLTRWVRILSHSEEKNLKFWNQKTLEKLNNIFIELSSERDPKQLLGTILVKAIDLVDAETGQLYLMEEVDGEMVFKLKVTHLGTNQVSILPHQVKVGENSICGYAALTGKVVNIPAFSEMRPTSVPQYLRSVDLNPPTPLQSILTLPFKSSRNEIIAILQIANKKSTSLVREFEIEEESLLNSLSTQAAICLENVDLYADIQKLFEGFVKASITAIEARDPSTGGHSERVAKLCVGLARATSECNVGIYRSVKFKDQEIRELEYAALLHDFGKIGVREEVLVKAKKLHSWQLDSIRERIKICKAAVKIAYLEQRLKEGSEPAQAEREFTSKIQKIEEYWRIIVSSNEPTVLRKEAAAILTEIKNEQLLLPDGSFIALLAEEEYKALAVTQGSLTEAERLEVESHVRHTYQFLKMIPWTKDFKNLSEIAYGHHEKLDGSGYPRGLISHEIPLQSKIMTIADIYDALTAADRWYKEAVPKEKALEILAFEVNQGKLDPVLYELFVEKKIYEVTQNKTLKIA